MGAWSEATQILKQNYVKRNKDTYQVAWSTNELMCILRARTDINTTIYQQIMADLLARQKLRTTQ